MIKYKVVETKGELIDSIRLRVDVFIKEQGFQPGWEPDECDEEAVQFIALDGKRIIGTARSRMVGKKAKLERFAVNKKFRGQGIGKGLILESIKYLKKKKVKSAYLNSQYRVRGFYAKMGFKEISKPFDEHGLKHIRMEINLK